MTQRPGRAKKIFKSSCRGPRTTRCGAPDQRLKLESGELKDETRVSMAPPPTDRRAQSSGSYDRRMELGARTAVCCRLVSIGLHRGWHAVFLFVPSTSFISKPYLIAAALVDLIRSGQIFRIQFHAVPSSPASAATMSASPWRGDGWRTRVAVRSIR